MDANMIRMELRGMEKRDLFELVWHQEMRWCNIGSRECAFFFQYKSLGFCLTELLGRGCSPDSEPEDFVENKEEWTSPSTRTPLPQGLHLAQHS